MTRREPDYDEMRDAADERRRMRRYTSGCRCWPNGAAPGYCPGPANCPLRETEEGGEAE